MKNKEKLLKAKRERRQVKIRTKINGTAECPRLNVFKSNKGMFLQLIDDVQGKTLASAHMGEVKGDMKKVDASFELGKILAAKALEKKIEKVVFDRGGFSYHGRVKAAADGAREGGLKF